MITFWQTKSPTAILDYTMNWASWLPSGDTIDSVVITVPTGITLDSQANTTTTVTAWLSGGTAGQNYDVLFKITTTAGREDDRTLQVRVRVR